MSYETNKLIPSLSEVRRKEREEAEQKKNQEAKELLIKSMEFYDKHYPRSEYKNTWTDPKHSFILNQRLNLTEMLDNCTEDELYQIFNILDYAHDERFIVNIPDHDKMRWVKAVAKKMIPGGNYIEKLNKLRKENETTMKQILELEEQLAIDKKKFEEKLEEKQEPEDKKYVCHICGFTSKNGGGLSSHMRFSHGGT